jgi:hypothetical protein
MAGRRLSFALQYSTAGPAVSGFCSSGDRCHGQFDATNVLQEHEKLLEQALTTSPNNWELLAKYPVWREAVEYPDALQVYERVRATEPAHGSVHLDMRRSLGKSPNLELSLKGKKD